MNKGSNGHGSIRFSTVAVLIKERFLSDRTVILCKPASMARLVGLEPKTAAKALNELVQAKVLFRSDGFYTNRPPRKPTPHQETQANPQPACAGN